MGKTWHVSFLDYHNIILLLGLLESNQGYGIAKKKKKISFQTRRKNIHTHTYIYRERESWVTHKRWRKINKDWHGDRRRGWEVDYLWVHLKCASWSCCWSGLDVLMWIPTAYWRRRRMCSPRWRLHMSLRNKRSGKHPERGEATEQIKAPLNMCVTHILLQHKFLRNKDKGEWQHCSPDAFGCRLTPFFFFFYSSGPFSNL